MPHPRSSFPSVPRGTTLLETALVVTLLAALSFAGLRGFTRMRDHWAVHAARVALSELIREARSRAVARGGARVTVSAPARQAHLEAGGVIHRRMGLGQDYGVDIDLGGSSEVTLAFDAAGVGRMASRSIGLRRGRARAGVVVSSYGRVR